MNSELLLILLFFGLGCVVTLAYGIRVMVKGQAHFERVDKQGGSALLSKRVMELGYWFFQPIARRLVSFNITANQVSIMSLVLGLFAGICLAYGHFGAGAVFASISAVMDALDGIVARSTGMASDAGEVLDVTVDRYVEFFFLGGLAVYYRQNIYFLVLTLFALVGAYMVSYSTLQAKVLNFDPPKGVMRRPERVFYLILGAALSPVTISWFEIGRDYPDPIAHPMIIVLVLVAVLANLSALERLWATARSVREREKSFKN